MALPKLEMGKGFGKDAGGGAPGVDPELLRLLAKRRQRQGLLGAMTDKGQRREQPQTAFKVKGAPIDPRLRAAMILNRKIREQQQQAQAPGSGRKA